MQKPQISFTYAFLAFGFLILSTALPAQDEVRLSDGGILRGKIIRQTETVVELKHESFGVITIPKSKILQMGPYGTLPSMPGTEADSAAARKRAAPDGSKAPATSRLDLNYVPDKYEPVPLPGAIAGDGADESLAELNAEMTAHPELADLYHRLLRHDVIRDEDAQLLLNLNDRAEKDETSLSVLERKILKALMGEEENTAAESAPEKSPPADLKPTVDAIRSKLDAIGGLAYSEVFTMDTPSGKVVIRYNRQVRRPNLAAGTGEIVEHPDPSQTHREMKYFADGQNFWLLTRDKDGGGNTIGSRVDYTTWGASGYPVEEMSRADLLLKPFAVVDLSTLKIVSENDASWTFSATIDSPAFAPMRDSELTISKDSGLLESMRLSGESLNATLEISSEKIDPGLPDSIFLAPEMPNGETFNLVEVPKLQSQALGLLGAL